MKIGIVGLPNVGKSTLFQALTKKQVDTSNYPFATIDPNVGVVAVPDERLKKLAQISNSKKIIPATIEFVDIAGLVAGAHDGEGLGNKFLSHIREVDAIVEVVRVFEDSSVHHVGGRIDPEGDVGIIHTELILADVATVQKAMERVARSAKSGDAQEKKNYETYEKINSLLLSENFASQDAPELHLLTTKPFIMLFNSTEVSLESQKKYEELAKRQGASGSVFVNIKLEDEIAQLGEAAGELAELSQINSLIQKAYEVLGLITFLTTGEDETRAWPIPRDSTAPRAGRAIHSDFETKFIRADVIQWADLLKAGSWSRARELGILQTKGKDYIVQDGDVIEFKV